MKSIRLILASIVMIASYSLTAQMAINTDGSSADSTAMLDVKSTTKGFLLPRLSYSEMVSIPSPAEGLWVYNTTSKTLNVFDGTIWKDMAGISVQLAIGDVTVDEGAGTATFTVTLTGDVQDSFTVDYATSDNTATAGVDYTTTSGTLTFPANAADGATQTFTVGITDDTQVEPTETYTVSLSNITGLITIADGTAVGTITDNDTSSISIGDVTVDEEAGTATFTVTLTGDVQDSFTVDYATSDNTAMAGVDYTATSGTLTFPANAADGATQTFTVGITDDTQAEPTETYTVSLSNITGLTTIADGTAVGTITDIDNAIGDFYQGGVIFYLDGNGGGLVCAVSDQSVGDGAVWGCVGTTMSGADGTAIGTGSQNTIDIEAGCTTPGIAADICANLSLNGYADWFLPSIDELTEMYENRVAINATAIANGGAAFSGHYWSSSEFTNEQSDIAAWYRWFISDTIQGLYKGDTSWVRAVRAF